MVKIIIKNKTLLQLHKTMENYSKIYDGINLKYNHKKKIAILTLTGRKKWQQKIDQNEMEVEEESEPTKEEVDVKLLNQLDKEGDNANFKILWS